MNPFASLYKTLMGFLGATLITPPGVMVFIGLVYLAVRIVRRVRAQQFEGHPEILKPEEYRARKVRKSRKVQRERVLNRERRKMRKLNRQRAS